MSASCFSILVTGLSEFIAPWNTIEVFSHRYSRSALPDNLRMSMSVPDLSWKMTVPELILPGSFSIWLML